MYKVCQNYSTKLSNGGNVSEEEKMENLRLYNDHIQTAKVQRDYYRTPKWKNPKYSTQLCLQKRNEEVLFITRTTFTSYELCFKQDMFTLFMTGACGSNGRCSVFKWYMLKSDNIVILIYEHVRL